MGLDGHVEVQGGLLAFWPFSLAFGWTLMVVALLYVAYCIYHSYVSSSGAAAANTTTGEKRAKNAASKSTGAALKKGGKQQIAGKRQSAAAGAGNKAKLTKNGLKLGRNIDDKTAQYTCPWLVTTLKGHTDEVLDMDFSANGKFLASTAKDRSIFLWYWKEVEQKGICKSSVRVNIDCDHASFIKWSPDDTAFIVHRFDDNVMEVYRVDRAKGREVPKAHKVITFTKQYDDYVTSIGMANNGKYIISCSSGSKMTIWDVKGQVLAHIDTRLSGNICAKMSPCSRFIVVGGCAGDKGHNAAVWNVQFHEETGEFRKCQHIFDVTGHTADDITDVAFDAQCSRIATISRDGTWYLYETNSDLKKGKFLQLALSNHYDVQQPQSSGAEYDEDDDEMVPHVALTSNGNMLMMTAGEHLVFYEARFHGTQLYAISMGACINASAPLLIDSSDQYVVVSVDRQIRVFHNVPGRELEVDIEREKLREKLTKAQRNRIEAMLQAHEEFMARINSTCPDNKIPIKRKKIT